MKKYLKVCFALFFVLATLCITGCNCKYAFYWEKEKTTVQDFILEQKDDGTYAIVNLTPLARHKGQLTIPSVIKNGEEYLQISEINLSFSDSTFLKKVIIKNPNFNPNTLNGCKSIYCIETDFYLTENLQEYFKDIKDIKIYLTDEPINPEQYEDFVSQENVFLGRAPKVSEIKNGSDASSNQTLAVFVYMILIILLIIGFLVNLKEVNKHLDNKPLFISLFALTVLYAGFLIVNQIFNNGFYSYLIIGLPLVLPVIAFSLHMNFVFTRAGALSSIPTYGSIALVLLNLIMGGAQGFWLIFIIALLICGLIIFIMEENRVDGWLLAIVTIGLVALILFAPTLIYWLMAYALASKSAFWILLAVVIIGGGVAYFALGLDGVISFSSSSVDSSGGYSDDSYSDVPKTIAMDDENLFSILCGMTDYKLPSGCCWSNRPTITQRGNEIVIKGEIDMGEFDSYWSVSQTKERCNDAIMKTAEKKIDEHCKTYGVGGRYRIVTEINYKYEI